MIVPIFFVLGSSNPLLTAIIENALGSFISWTVQLLIFGPKVYTLLVGMPLEQLKRESTAGTRTGKVVPVHELRVSNALSVTSEFKE